MRKRIGAIIAAAIAAAIGIAWFAMRERDTATAPADETPVRKKIAKAVPAKAKARRTAAAKSKAKVDKTGQTFIINQDEGDKAGQTVTVKQEKQLEPAQEEQAAQEKKNDNPFPRYLDMFKNNPEALAAEFLKEAEADNARQRKLREGIIAEWKLNQEQAAMFEKALDDLKAEITRQNEEYAGLVKSGELNYEDDGSIFTSNRLLGQRFVAAREAAMRETSEKLYGQLELDGVSDAEKQRWLFIATQRAVFSYECFEPYLAVYDKVYKNMGFGNGIFSWCKQQEKK